MKHYGKLYAAAAAGFMALNALGAAPAFAADTVSGNEVNITKTLELVDGVKPATAVKFSYTVTPVDNQTAPAGGLPNETVFNGVAGGLTASEAVQSTVTDKTMSFTGAKLTAHANVFKFPGIYQYTVKETPNADTAEYEDITNSSESYTVNVYVGYNAEGTLEVTNLVITGKNGKTDAPSFVESQYDPAALTVIKRFAGNQAIATDTFDFTVKITGKAGEEYIITLADGDSQTVTAGADGTVTTKVEGVGKNKSFTISGLSDTDKYEIVENEETLKGYTSSGTLTGSIANDKTDAEVTNTKNGAVPTGILMTAAPYAALVGLGAIFAGFFFRRKRED